MSSSLDQNVPSKKITSAPARARDNSGDGPATPEKYARRRPVVSSRITNPTLSSADGARSRSR